MKQDYTHITVILDRSGSMESIRDDTTGGFNVFLEKQKAEPGQATLTLVQFDSQDPYEVIHGFKPIADIPALDRETYVPRGGTPLLDALGRGINDLEQSIGKLAEADRPAKVVFAIVTDGKENASSEFTKDQVEQMIKRKTEKDEWQFVFLSNGLAAIAEAKGLGVADGRALMFRKSARGTSESWAALSSQAAEYRSGRKRQIGFGQADRDRASAPDVKKP